MASRQEQPLQGAFTLQQNAGALVLSTGRRSKAGGLVLASQRSAPSSGACSFTTRAAGTVGKRMLVIKPASGAARASAALPMASLTLSLPWRGKKEVAPPAKKKRTAKEVWDSAVKSALRGGLPGMGAMAIQVGWAEAGEGVGGSSGRSNRRSGPAVWRRIAAPTMPISV
jgi:hypothetical protein